ncbi:dynein regulatory complex protein 9 isoform X2 [Cyprinodon tularosa]|uniref:dynein regulatory complex protein 9 isoform X2 n=1 Tax=Cyprinodon tularosa TaxID=77115 RepID=UPI0018E24D1D|nr:dynein regulatory complex protein 9 isoform X2 [Cyprinodon tularosa]
MEKQKNEEEREEEKLPLKDFEQKLLRNWPKARKMEQLEVLEEEKRFHDKTMEFLQNQHELEQELHMLKEKTQQIQQENREKFNTLGCKKTLQTDRLMEMKRKFREMEQVVKEYREEQEILCQKEAEDRAAIKIQTWWRGCMVRLGLSASSRERESKKSKKTKGKKTKGK